MSVETTFLRDLNRAKDADRNMRKRGLQKLMETLPWEKTTQRRELLDFISQQVFSTVLTTVSDPIEKCRECSLRIVLSSIKIWEDMEFSQLQDLTSKCCSRIEETPFPETAEELRLTVVEILLEVVAKASRMARSAEVDALHGRILQAAVKALSDSFPNVKRACAEVICLISASNPDEVRLHGRALIKALVANASHQHAKTRVLSLEAMTKTLCCLSISSYRDFMKETVLAVFLKAVMDRTAMVRVDLAGIVAHLLDFRIGQCATLRRALLDVDIECIVLLLLLAADSTEGVSSSAQKALAAALRNYDAAVIPRALDDDDAMDESVTDGEAEMRSMPIEEEGSPCDRVAALHAPPRSADEQLAHVRDVMALHLADLATLLIQGTDNWAIEQKVRYITGLQRFVEYVQGAVAAALPAVLAALAVHVRDDELEVRRGAEACCQEIGARLGAEMWLDVVLPRVLGQLAGGDTAQQRTGALRVCCHLWRGRGTAWSLADPSDPQQREVEVAQVEACASALASPGLLAYRDVALREALVLTLRALIEVVPEPLWATSTPLQRSVVLALLYLSGKGPHEQDIVTDVAKKEMAKLALLCNAADGEALIAAHFLFCIQRIVLGVEQPAATTLDALAPQVTACHPHWDAPSPNRIAFTQLLLDCSRRGWAFHALLLPVISCQAQPTSGPAAGSMEANLQSYAAQRGDDVTAPHRGEVDVRLGLLAALEGFIRAGVAHWECGPYLAAAAQTVVQEILVPNLVWRIGRVEATIRKVALAATFGILKAGAISFETLFRIATELVPLLVSNLDDMEVSPRLMACLALTVVFDRLKGVFSEQSVREMYPKLIARLDDSSDEVRVAACQTLTAFFGCAAARECYNNTLVDYCLDQLFIHLDDPQPAIQQAVLPVILRIGREVDGAAVGRKAEAQRTCHRSPLLCEKILRDLR